LGALQPINEPVNPAGERSMAAIGGARGRRGATAGAVPSPVLG
jgi:hypothetical protein